MSERDRHILRLIERHGLVTVEALMRVLGLSRKAAERILTRLMAAGLIDSAQLLGRTCYYMFTASGARLAGLDEAASRPMGTQAMLQNVAMLNHCLLGPAPAERMTRAEFVAKFPAFAVRGVISSARRTRYYLDVSERREGGSGVVRLALMLPTAGSNPRRIARKARREVEKRRRASQPLAELIRARLFSVVVLVESEEKAGRVEAMLAKDPWHSRAAVVPGYLDLLISIGAKNRHDRPAQDSAPG
jgi:hypothetical protein